MAHLFNVWDGNRDKKAFVVVHGTENLIERVILKACEKLELDGSSLVLEKNGTPVEEDEVLILLKAEVLLLLKKDEVWTPVNDESTSIASSSRTSLATTVTVSSIADSEVENIDILNIPCTIISDSNFEFLWSNFQIPWDKIPTDVMQRIEKGERSKNVITELVHTIVYEMRLIKKNVPKVAFKYAVQKIIDRFPEIFRDVDIDGVVIGDGTHSLICKMTDRNNYLNRPHKRGLGNLQSSSLTTMALKKKKLNASAGCVHWDAEVQTESMEENKEILKTIPSNNAELISLLEKTYGEQRKYLNNLENPPTIDDIQKEWPILFTKPAIEWHFNKVTNTNINDLITSLEEKSQNIIKHAIERKILEKQSGNPIRDCLEFYSKCFKEHLDHFLVIIKSEDVEPSSVVTINAPCIIDIDNNTDVNIFYIYAERKKVLECSTFAEALKYCFALYFILNLQYPNEIGVTLEMLHRFHLKIHPDSGTKTKTASKKKVICLMNKLKDIF